MLLRQSATRTITAPTTRDNRRKVPDMKEVREGSTYSQDKDISFDFGPEIQISWSYPVSPGLGQCLEEKVEQTERLCPKKQDWVSAG